MNRTTVLQMIKHASENNFHSFQKEFNNIMVDKMDNFFINKSKDFFSSIRREK